MRMIALAQLFILLLSTNAYAGPFGLNMGMNIKQLQAISKMENNEPFIYRVKKVPKPSTAIEDYYLTVTPKTGLCKIQAISQDISTSVYGDELMSRYNNIKETLSKKYGEARTYDFLKTGSIWNEPKDWMMGLLQKERTLATFWAEEYGSKLDGNLESISLRVIASNQNSAWYMIQYEFTNSGKCHEEMKGAEADAY